MMLKYRNTTHWGLTNYFLKLRFFVLSKSKRYENYFSNTQKSRFWIKRDWNRATRYGSFLGEWEWFDRIATVQFWSLYADSEIKKDQILRIDKWLKRKITHYSMTLNSIKTWNSKMSKNYLYFWKVISVMIIVFIVAGILIRHFTTADGTRDRERRAAVRWQRRTSGGEGQQTEDFFLRTSASRALPGTMENSVKLMNERLEVNQTCNAGEPPIISKSVCYEPRILAWVNNCNEVYLATKIISTTS